MNKPPTDKQRVLNALRAKQVVTIGDFSFPRAPFDGGKPITRVAARIYDLQRDGFVIDSIRTTLGSAKVAGYVLKSSPSAGAVAHAQSSDGPVPPAGSSSPTSPAGRRVNAGAPVRVGTAPPAAPAPLPPNTTPVADPSERDISAAPQPALFDTPSTGLASSPYREAA